MNKIQSEAEKLLKDNDLSVKFNDRGGIEEIRCKGCGLKIAGMVVSDREPQHVAMGDKLVVVTPVEFVHLSAYDEGTVEFDDKSAHVTSGCKACLARLKREPDLKVLEDWYIRDVAVWMKEISAIGHGELHFRNFNRTPLRIV